MLKTTAFGRTPQVRGTDGNSGGTSATKDDLSGDSALALPSLCVNVIKRSESTVCLKALSEVAR